MSWAKLEIPSARYEHSGSFRVRLENEAGEAECAAELQIEGISPVFRTQSVIMNAIINQQLRLETIVEAQPRANIYWEYDGQEVTGQRYNCFSEGDKQILVLDELLGSDAGRYTCVAENELGESKWTANVRVDLASGGKSDSPDSIKSGKGKHSPLKKRSKDGSPKRRDGSPSKSSKKHKRSKSKDLSLAKGASPTGSSASSAMPQTPSEAEPDWMVEEKKKAESGKRKVKKFTPVVADKEHHKKSKLVVSPGSAARSEKPVFIEVPEAQEYQVSEVAEFKCRVAGDPMPEIQWYKGKWGKLSSFGRIKVEYEKSSGVSTLKVSKLDKPDKGMYRVVAKNKHGEANCQFELTVKDKASPGREEIQLKKRKVDDDDKNAPPPVELLKYVDPKEYEKYANHFGITDFRNLLAPVGQSETEQASSEYESSFSPSESDISDFSLVDVLADIRDTSCRIGTNASFSTELRVNMPGVDVQWYKKKDRITNSDKFKITQRGDIHELTVNNLTPDDIGEYRIVAGPYQRSAKLEIIQEDEGKGYCPKLYLGAEEKIHLLAPDARPFFTMPLLDLTNVHKGDHVELNCKVSEADLEVEWLCDDMLICCTQLDSIPEGIEPRVDGKPPIHPDSYNKFSILREGHLRQLIVNQFDPVQDQNLNICCRAAEFPKAKTSAKIMFAGKQGGTFCFATGGR